MPETNEEKLVNTVPGPTAEVVIEAASTPVVETAPAAPVEATAPTEEVEELPPPPQHTYLLKDISDHIDRVRRSKHLGETKGEFADNLYPFLQAIIDHFGERLDKTETALVEMIDQTDSFVQADLAILVANALNLGKAMASIIQQFKPGMTLDAKGVAKMHGLAAQYIAAADEAAMAVAEVTIEPGDDDDDEEEDE